MATQPICFVWGTPPVPAGRWHAGLLNVKRLPTTTTPPDAVGPAPASAAGAATAEAAASTDPWHDYRRHRLHLSLRGLLAWSLALSAATYFAGAALVHKRLELASTHNRVAYRDLVLPSRWAEFERLRGETFIAEARERLERNRFHEGFSLLRLGLARHPADHAARLELAKLYVALRLAPQAAKLLREGLELGYPGRDSLVLAFALASEADAPAGWVELAALARARFDALPAAERADDESLWLDQQHARALLAAGRGDKALMIAVAGYPEAHAFRRELEIVRLIDADRAAEARPLAEAWAAAAPRAPEPLRLLARAWRQLAEHAALDATLARLRALDPANPEPLLYALAQQQLAGRPEAARTALEALLLRHGAAPDLYPTLANVLGEVRDLDGLGFLETEITELGLSRRPVLQARLQASVAAREWPGVLRLAEELRASPGPALDERQALWVETVSRLARACLDAGSGNQAALVQFVGDRPGTLRLYVSLLEALLEAGRPATARQIIHLAEGPYPVSTTLAALRVRVDGAVASVPAPAAAPETTAPGFPSAGALAEAVGQHVRRGETAEALRLLAAARRARPDWLPAAEARLDALELPLRARSDDPLRLQWLVRAELARGPQTIAPLLALARELHGETPAHRDHARLLVKEILRHDPNHPDAIDQLAVWEPPAARAPLDTAP